jgi:hypothetical protein
VDRSLGRARVIPMTLPESLALLWATCKNLNFLLLVSVNALCVGSLNAWAAAVDPLMSPLGYSQVIHRSFSFHVFHDDDVNDCLIFLNRMKLPSYY